MADELNSPLSPRQQYLRRLSALKMERSTWDGHWRELADVIQPRRSRFFGHEANKGQKKNQNIINSTPTWAARVLGAGMMAGITSPARQWFRLTTPDPELADHAPVRSWLHQVEERLMQMFARSNLYKGLAQVYLDLGTFGVSAMYLEDSPRDFLRAYVFPIGSYCLANNDEQRVDTIYREPSMTVGQLVSKFTREKCSQTVQMAFDRGNVDQWIPVLHVVEPNAKYRHGRAGPAGMRFRSCWFEAGAGASGSGAPDTDYNAGFLRESGFEEFPVMCPRWAVTGEDVYGSSPGMDALGDARALQTLEKRKGQLVEKLVNPPMRGPSSLMNQRTSLLPGDTTYVDAVHPGQTFAPAHEVLPAAVQVVGAEIREHAERVKTAYYADLWLMMANNTDSDPQKTAREVAELHEEKMLQLGPVLEQLEDELLDPTINRAFGVGLRNGDFPHPPDELQGVELHVEYLSVMAQAQKLIGTSSIERMTTFVLTLAQQEGRPEAMDKLNVDKIVDEYANRLGVKPDLINTEDQVAAIRQQRAQQMQQAQQAQQAAQAVDSAQKLSQTDTSGDNALTQLVGPMAAAAGGGLPH